MQRALRALGMAGGGVLLLFGAGCSTEHYRRSADTEAYRAIQDRAWRVDNMEPGFTIEHTNQFSLDGLPRAEGVAEFLGDAAQNEKEAAILSLEKALALAVDHSRTYQNTREDLYLTALGYTLARHAFTPLFSAGGSALAAGSSTVAREEAQQIVNGVATNVTLETVTRSTSFTADGQVDVNWLIRDIGRLSVAFTADLTRLFTSGPQSMAASQLAATFSRPLLRNNGYQRELEALVQSERNLLYEMRDFTRFRKGFSVEIATAYYRVLGLRDSARNAFMNLQSSRLAAARFRALAEEGRATQSDLGRLQQQELSAESAWINAVLGYRRELDDLKIRLGIPVKANVILADEELARLTIRHPQVQIEDSVRIALAARLDYQNQVDQLADAARKVDLAADGFLPQLDLTASASINSAATDQGFPALDPDRYRWNAGLILDLPLERKAERNAYRAALINWQRSGRAVSLLRDQIELQVRDSWRSLEQARRNYEISEIGVRLAERRVEEQVVLAEMGRARAQDQVDAQNDLVKSRDQRTQALVGHTIALLQFWNNLGILYIKDNGSWEEPHEAQSR